MFCAATTVLLFAVPFHNKMMLSTVNLDHKCNNVKLISDKNNTRHNFAESLLFTEPLPNLKGDIIINIIISNWTKEPD